MNSLLFIKSLSVNSMRLGMKGKQRQSSNEIFLFKKCNSKSSIQRILNYLGTKSLMYVSCNTICMQNFVCGIRQSSRFLGEGS